MRGDTFRPSACGTEPATLALLLVASLFVVGGCGGGNHPPKPPPSKVVYVGEVGVLPTPQAARPGPTVVLPPGPLHLVGNYALGSLVKFNVPVRNDGTRALDIRKIDPG